MPDQVISTDGTPIAVWRIGDGPPLVLVHGTTADHSRWAPAPTQIAEQPTAALGTALRADTVRALAVDAGFARAEVLPVPNDFFRLYRLDP